MGRVQQKRFSNDLIHSVFDPNWHLEEDIEEAALIDLIRIYYSGYCLYKTQPYWTDSSFS